MAHIETLSTTTQTDFTEVWYDIADEEHFWLRWRFAFFLREIRRLGLDPALPMTGLDIGCGHGAVGRQLAAQTAWRADGCDLNKAALAQHSTTRRVLYYDINDRHPALRESYDFLIMFDVIEHIDETRPFLEAAIDHLKPGGHVFINVPACQRLYSRYDSAAGHYRRYDKPMLRHQLEEAGLAVRSMQYWGGFLLPALAARKLLVDRKNTSSDIIRTGFHPPNRFASMVMSAALACENMLPPLPMGSSLLAVARKPRSP